MDQKSWPWKKKSSEKTTVARDKVSFSEKANHEEIQTLLTDKARLEKDLNNLNDKLSLAISECNTKDELVKKHVKMAQEAMAELEKAEREAVSLKQDLEEAMEQRAAGEERITHLDAALKECMQQLRFVREEQEQRIHDALMKTSAEFAKSQRVLEEKLANTAEVLAKMGVENTNLSKALLAKEKMIENLNRELAGLEADINALITRLDSAQKDNASLKYEVRVLEKEVEIRNEEREFNRRTSEASHKQHLVSVKKIAKLESECQRLRVLVRKRLPGPAALAKMKNEVEMLGTDSFEIKRRQSHHTSASVVDSPVTPTQRISILTEQLSILEEENKDLKEALAKRTNELQTSRDTFARIASKISLVESMPEESSKGLTISDIDSNDKISCVEPWASPFITKFDQFRNGKTKGPQSCKPAVGASDLDLMNDFVEMEKLALVSDDKPVGNSHIFSNQANTVVGSFEAESNISLVNDSAGEATDMDKTMTEKSNHQCPSDLSESLRKLIELIEGISLSSPDCDNSDRNDRNMYSEIPEGYTVRVFQWKFSEIKAVLKEFIHCCDDLLNGKVDPGGFLQGLTTALEWILNHCFSIQDVSIMKASIKNHLDWDESRSENEVEIGMNGYFSEVDKLQVPREQISCLNMAPTNSHNVQLGELQSNFTEDDTKLNEESMTIESENKDLDGRLQSTTDASKSLMNQLQESEKTVVSLHQELETLKESKGLLPDQISNQQLMNQDLDTQLLAARAKLNEALQMPSSLEVKVADKIKRHEELHEMKLESVIKMQTPENDRVQEEKQLRTDLEITAASEKLALCQETILNLGKQLKALAAPREAALLDRVISAPTDTIDITASDTATTTTPPNEKNTSHRFSLLDRMLAEDDTTATDDKLPQPIEVDSNSASVLAPDKPLELHETAISLNGLKTREDNAKVGSLAIVPCKKRASGSLWRKLWWRKRRVNNTKRSLPFAP